jgi:hypothetical protein
VGVRGLGLGSEEASYLDLVQVIESQGARGGID